MPDVLAFDSWKCHPDPAVRAFWRAQPAAVRQRRSGYALRAVYAPSMRSDQKAKEPDMLKTRGRILAMDATPEEEAVAQLLAHLRANMDAAAAEEARGMIIALLQMCKGAEMAQDGRGSAPAAMLTRFPDAGRLGHR